jgi:hypothetical protein
MKVVLQIGGQVHFIAPDAATAAKVADLLGQMQPAREQYHYIDGADRPGDHVLIHGRDSYSHRVEIRSLDGRHVFADETAFGEWAAEKERDARAKMESGKEAAS